MQVRRRLFAVVAVLLVGLVGITVMELAFRWLDGYRLFGPHLVSRGGPVTAPDARAYLSRFALAPKVELPWYFLDPEHPTGNIAADPDLSARERASPAGLGAVFSSYEWNREYVRWAACEHPEFFDAQFKPSSNPPDIFVFEPVDGGRFPSFRFLRSSHNSGISTNQFGWRGPDIALRKPAGTVRIAFVGASTTVNPHGDPFSYPDYIRRWLSEWARRAHPDVQFEVMNAGREGINSNSIEGIVRTEVAPVDPDFVVYYEGSNQFWPADYLGTLPAVWTPSHPPPSVFKPVEWPLVNSSATARRLADLVGSRLREPEKPTLDVRWPGDLDEADPDLHHPRLPVNLNAILSDLDGMRVSLDKQGARLVLTSFLWCVYDGMRLNPVTNAGLYGYLNGPFWPFSYAHMRRFARFQNTVFRKYAVTHGLPFIDVEDHFPLEPVLFGDAIHMSQLGVKLMAWSVFQQLVRQIDLDLQQGRLPRRMAVAPSVHPAFREQGRRTLPVATAAAWCGHL